MKLHHGLNCFPFSGDIPEELASERLNGNVLANNLSRVIFRSQLLPLTDKQITMQNITPEDRATWQKKITDHLKRQKRRALLRFIKGCIAIACTVIVVCVTVAVFSPVHIIRPADTQATQEAIDDSLQGSADLSPDSSLDEMRKTPVGKEYDSLAKGRDSL